MDLASQITNKAVSAVRRSSRHRSSAMALRDIDQASCRCNGWAMLGMLGVAGLVFITSW